MNNFTFLTADQIFGTNQLSILKKYGIKCAITDFAILLGGKVEPYFFTSEGQERKNRAGWWWSSTQKDAKYARVCGLLGQNILQEVTSRDIGARPAISYSSISSNSLNAVRDKNGILEVEYGEYPQTIVSEICSNALEKGFANGTLKVTGKRYVTDSISFQDKYTSFGPKIYTEYEYNGSRYIRFVAEQSYNGVELSDGESIQRGNIYWIEVEPIKWMVDINTNIALSKKIIFSGVQFSNKQIYNENFSTTDIDKFMNSYFKFDIKPKSPINLSQNTKGHAMLNEGYVTLNNYGPIENQTSHENITNDDNQQTNIPKQKVEKTINPYGFNFDKVSEEDIIKGAIQSGLAVYLHGPSAEGKSARVKQIDPDCVIVYLRNATPESLNGKSVYNSETGEMIDIKPTWLKKLEERCEREPNKNHIVFFDEITNALPSIQGMAFNIVLDGEVNGIWQLPKNARVVAAGNDMEDSLAANELAEPLARRFVHVYINTTVESWLQWASENNIHPAIYAYIAYKKGETLRSKYDGTKPSADPRKWEMASKMLYATGQPEMLRSLVGDEITKEFCQFCRQKVITLEDVISGNYTERDLQMNTSEIYATAMGLSQVDEANFEKVREFVLKLGGEPCAIFDSLWAHGDEARMEIVAEARLVNKSGGKKI